jgi:two-component system nitrogen regulation sensor histidine kinase GlnL
MAKARIKAMDKGDTAVETPVDTAAMIAALSDAVLLLSGGAIVLANPAAQMMLGLSQRQMLGKTAADIFGADHPVTGHARQMRGHTLHDCTIAGVTAAVTLVPMADGGMMIVIRGTSGAIRSDWVTRMRHTLKPAQHLARMLAHEIKNPLAGIRAAAQLLQKSGLSADDTELAVLIGDETGRVLRMIDKVNVFDDDSFVPEAVNVNEVIERAARASGLASVSCRFDPSLPPVDGSFDRLVQAFLNVIRNADEAGARAVSIRSFFDTHAAFHPENGLKLPIVIEIADDGRGMDVETRDRLFELYYTTKSSGEGLGLAIVSKIVDDHGGVVDVTSAPGQTVFRFSFPRSKSP